MLSERDSLAKSNAAAWSRVIQSQALELPDYLAAGIIALYSPVRNEVGTEMILEQALKAGKQVFYPRTGVENAIEFVQVRSPAELGAGPFGIAEPTGATKLAAKDRVKTVMFVPGVAFDAQGHRLGRGRGWYDRAQERFGKAAVFVALAYHFQIVDALPTEPWDRSVQYIITEKRIFDCAANAPQSREVF